MGTNYVKKQRTVRLPAVTQLQANAFSSAGITTAGSSIYNGIILQYPDGTPYVTQRPSFNVTFDPDDSAVTDNRGRGIYYWDQAGGGLYVVDGYVDAGYLEGSQTPALYIVNANNIYYNTYATAMTGDSITTGTKKVYIRELGDNLVFLDTENNQMWYTKATAATVIEPMNFSYATESMTFSAAGDTITTTSNLLPLMSAGDKFTVSGTANYDTTTFTVVSHVDAGANDVITVSNDLTSDETVSTTLSPYGSLPQNNSKTLADGLAVLDQTMYVLDTDGQVWGSAIGDAQSWVDGTNFVTAEREEDAGVFLAKHHDNLVVFGERTIEFLYNAGNATGSSLSVREDISYNVGCEDPLSVWQTGDDIYFLGRDNLGHIQAYILKDFQISPISTPNLSSYLSANSGGVIIGNGFGTGGITYYILTAGGTPSDFVPNTSIVYNSATSTWTEWELSGSITDNFPVISTAYFSGTPHNIGLLTTGEAISIQDNYNPKDDATNITMKIRLDNFDNDSRDWKFAHQLRFVGDAISSSTNMTIKWSDDNNLSYSSGRTIDISDSKNKLTRLGRFKSRSHELEYSGGEQIRVVGLDLDITEGTH